MTERTSMEPERAELLALADRLAAVHPACYLLERDAKRIASALRQLASQDQKPVAWHSPTDSATPFVKPYVKEAMLPHVAAQYSVPLYLSHQPAAAEINASAEARLREALRDLVWLVSTDRTYDDSESLRSARNVLFAENKAAIEAISAHPPASDCDKQECMGDISPGDPKDLAELLAKPSVLEPSDRPADVTVEIRKLAQRYIDCTTDDMPPEIKMPTVNELGDALCALLDAYKVSRP